MDPRSDVRGKAGSVRLSTSWLSVYPQPRRGERDRGMRTRS